MPLAINNSAEEKRKLRMSFLNLFRGFWKGISNLFIFKNSNDSPVASRELIVNGIILQYGYIKYLCWILLSWVTEYMILYTILGKLINIIKWPRYS